MCSYVGPFQGLGVIPSLSAVANFSQYSIEHRAWLFASAPKRPTLQGACNSNDNGDCRYRGVADPAIMDVALRHLLVLQMTCSESLRKNRSNPEKAHAM